MSLLCILPTWPLHRKLGSGVGYVSVVYINYMATKLGYGVGYVFDVYINYMATKHKVRLRCRLFLLCILTTWPQNTNLV
jgi:hypothetical protein